MNKDFIETGPGAPEPIVVSPTEITAFVDNYLSSNCQDKLLKVLNFKNCTEEVKVTCQKMIKANLNELMMENYPHYANHLYPAKVSVTALVLTLGTPSVMLARDLWRERSDD